MVTGTVRSGKEILPAASVSVGGRTVLTDNNGRFSISMAPTNYIITVTHVGYKRAEQAITVSTGITTTADFDLIVDEQLGEVVMIGSRSLTRRGNMNTVVPVDVFSSARLSETGQQDMAQMLNFSAASVNAARQGQANESITLHGLDPHHLLILINGIRYYNTAWINNGVPKSNMGRGSVGNDLSSIPFSAIDKIEILPEGASAQYGSDAIGGVINIRLKESINQTSIRTHAGRYYMGDGMKLSFGFNSGSPIKKKNLAGKKGLINYSADLWTREATSRGGIYTGSIYKNYPANATSLDSALVQAADDSIMKARSINRKMFTGFDGNSEVRSAAFSINSIYPVGNASYFFLTGSINNNIKSGGGSYRYPKNLTQVNTNLYPDGFRPFTETRNHDFLLMAGFKSVTSNLWHWELSSAYGSNASFQYVNHSNNASQYLLGKSAPTEFYLGKLAYNQTTNNISFTKQLAAPTENMRSTNLMIGAEWRVENYRQLAGDEASWKDYDSIGPRQGGAQPSIGSINPNNVVNKKRSVMGSYIDLETEMNERLLLDLAARFEHYNDFGGNLAGKLAFRYKLSPNFSWRAAISNGFRAPSMQQRFYEGTQSFRGTSLIQGLFSNSSTVTEAFGIPSLQAEKSLNINSGFVAYFTTHFNLTIDVYWIQIKNRIVLSGAFRKDNPDVAAKLVDYPNIDVLQFYVNAINTRTKGVDLNLNGQWQFSKTRLGLNLALNINKNEIFGQLKLPGNVADKLTFANTLFGIEERTALEKDQPGKKIIFTSTISKGKIGFRFANTYFGSTGTATIVANPTDTLFESFSSRILTDLSINYAVKQWITLTAGANNIFDIYPDRLKNPRNFADRTFGYSNGASPFGYNGGYYFLSMSLNL